MDRLIEYCEIPERVGKSFRDELSKITNAAHGEIRESLRMAEDELIKLRLAESPMHSVFSKAVSCLLERRGPLKTIEIHNLAYYI